MKNNKYLFLILSGIICLVINSLRRNLLIVSFFNSIILISYLYLFIKSISFTKYYFLPFLSFMPIFSSSYSNFYDYFVEGIVILIWLILIKLKKINILFLGLIFFIVYGYFVLSSNNVLKWPARIEVEQLIYPQHFYQLEIDRQQKESMYLPYQLRLLIFNEKTSYGYVFVGNIFSFLSLENLYRTILLVNSIFTIVGIYFINKLRKEYKYIVYISLITSMLLIGLLKTPDSMRPLASLRGIFLLLTLNGINNKRGYKIYIFLFILSLLINIA